MLEGRKNMPDLINKDGTVQYDFTGTFQKHSEDADDGWCFLFMPKELSKEIRANGKPQSGLIRILVRSWVNF